LSGRRFSRALSSRRIEDAAMIDRRTVIASVLAAAASPLAARAEEPAAVSRIKAYAFSFPGLSSGDIRLAEYSGRPLLVVNTASLCGYTPQYTGLQQIWTEFQGRGFGMIGVPCNDFGGQEPGGASEIAETAQHQYAVTFPITAKAVVTGAGAHPFYKWAAEARPKDVPKWNFHKYLIGRDGYIAEVFPSAVEPTDTRVKTAIARALVNT
jgi:glutathione peroxidase